MSTSASDSSPTSTPPRATRTSRRRISWERTSSPPRPPSGRGCPPSPRASACDSCPWAPARATQRASRRSSWRPTRRSTPAARSLRSSPPALGSSPRSTNPMTTSCPPVRASRQDATRLGGCRCLPQSGETNYGRRSMWRTRECCTTTRTFPRTPRASTRRLSLPSTAMPTHAAWTPRSIDSSTRSTNWRTLLQTPRRFGASRKVRVM
mmetsp:Transcript_1217/g.3491  ORF Transcript_1217/g.3491 Transcript_1217/m.3491 type:complete len:208 (-) Transcript_1217:2303-2926(-)